jgi:GntR family transcriptional regulator/MocR family aminotransferase
LREERACSAFHLARMEESGPIESLFPDRDSDEPLGHQFTRRLRQGIECGLFKPSSRLLPRRELALRLGLGRNTVSSAIEQLIAEGYLESRVGSGTFVVASVIKHATAAKPEAPRKPPGTDRFRAAYGIFKAANGLGPLRAGVPDLSHFPYAAWARITRRKLARLSEFLELTESKGEPELCEAIAQHVRQFRGVLAQASQVIVVEGTQAAIRLATDVLFAEGDSMVIEDPCYQFVHAALRARNISVLPVPVDEDGIDVALAPGARMAFVTPSHQFPLGSTLSLERRRALLAWARSNDAYILEDDYDSEFAFDRKPLPTLQSIDRDGRVIYIGTFSKTLAPALRLAYLVVPPHLAGTFAVARVFSTLGGTRYVQATLADFIAEGHFARYVRRMTRTYDERRRAVVRLLEESLPRDRFTLGQAHAGLHVAVVAASDFDDVAAAQALEREGTHVQPLSAFCVARSDCRGFVVGYGAAPLPETLAAVRRLIAWLQ